MVRRRLWIAIVWFVACSGLARGDDAFFHVTQSDLAKIVEVATFPDAPPVERGFFWFGNATQIIRPYAALDGKGEAFVLNAEEFAEVGTPRGGNAPGVAPWNSPLAAMFIRAPAGADVAGRLYVPKPGASGMVAIKFKISAATANDKFRHDFLLAKATHYDALVDDGVPGGAWFRHEARKARESAGEAHGDAIAGPPNPNRQPDRRELAEDSYDLFSGGRAVSENLQLDRALPAANREVPNVDVSSIDGITIAAIDWSKYLKAGANPKLDPLAAAIPEDQHAVFFPSFAKLMEVVDQADRQGTTVLQFANPRSEDARVRARYERQLCLSTSALSRLLGPALVRSVAVTGSDPYFPTGTDVAILFESAQPDTMHSLVLAQVMDAGTAADRKAKSVKGILGGSGDDAVFYIGICSPDRRICSYVARMGDVVVVTNSLAQLERLVEVHQHKRAAIAGLQEFKFFRTRYPLGSAEESALLFLSDATIRRWCGPKWRIASSRRTRDLGVLSDLQADFFDSLVRGRVEARPIQSELNAIDLGELRLTSSGVGSSTLGTLEFQTPIVELAGNEVTKAEADGYRRWRDRYQNNWRWAFDPIALRIHCGDKRLTADLTVMPLIVNSDYRQEVEISRGVKLAATAGDPHDAPIQWAMAFNRDSRPMRAAASNLKGLIRGETDPLSWIGSSISAWIEDDPFWDELASKTDDAARTKFLNDNIARLPIAVQIEVANPFKLTAFLVGVRGMIEQSAPDMVVWETFKYHDQPYVRLSLFDRAKKQIPAELKEPSLFYAIMPDGLLVTFRKRLLEQAIDRQMARQRAKAEGKPPAAPLHPWLGESQSFQLNQKAIVALAQLGGESLRSRMQRLAWSNLPILNEWKRRYPDRDPVALHEQFWQTRLVCPGGGRYVWNEEWQTMESTMFGHPGQPKPGPAVPPTLAGLVHANFGLTFEDEGLRARIELQQAPEKSAKPK